MYGEEFPGAMLNGELPAFFFHFSVGPVLELFEEGGFDYGEGDADAAFVADPHEAGFGQEEDVAFGQHEAHVEESRETERLFQAVETHAAGAEVASLHADFFSLRLPDRDRSLAAGAEKFLLLVADEAQRGGALSRSKVDVVFLELAAEGTAGDAELFGGDSALATGTLEGR